MGNFWPLFGMRSVISSPAQEKFSPGIEAATVVDRKNARVCIVARFWGFAMLICNVVMEHGAHAFKVHEKTELPHVSDADLAALIATALALPQPRRCSAARRLPWQLSSCFLSGLVLHALGVACRPLALLRCWAPHLSACRRVLRRGLSVSCPLCFVCLVFQETLLPDAAALLSRVSSAQSHC